MQSKITILIVDDHCMVRQTWKMLLHDYEQISVIGECKSGEEAIEAVPRLRPDVVLMDISMHGVNGFEATKEILKLAPGTKIIGISISDQPVYVRNLLQAGANGYVTKNSSREEMVLGIRSVVEGQTFICRDVQKHLKGDKS